MIHHNERTTISRRTGNGLVDFDADRCTISSRHIMQTFFNLLFDRTGDRVEMAQTREMVCASCALGEEFVASDVCGVGLESLRVW